MSQKIYHIYVKDKCLFHSIKEEEFHTTWKTIRGMIGIIKTDYSIQDLSYEEVTLDKKLILNSSH